MSDKIEAKAPISYEHFLVETAGKDSILIKLTDVFPFFLEKKFVKGGVETRDQKYHIHDGIRATYINYEIPDISISAKIGISQMKTQGPEFEVHGSCDCPAYVLNAGKEDLVIMIRYWMTPGILRPDEVVAISPMELAERFNKHFEEKKIEAFSDKRNSITQEEIIRLLNGG